MAKKSVYVDKNALIQALEEAEKNGPLSNLKELWEKAAEIYNANTAQKITYSVVMLRAKAWDIHVMTKAGRKGRQKGQAIQKTSFESIPLSDWETTTVTVGRNVGGQVTQRLACVLYKDCWGLAIENKDADVPMGKKFNCNFRLLLPALKNNFPEVDFDKAVKLLIGALSSRLGIKAKIDLTLPPQEIGKSIDAAFKTNMFCEADCENLKNLRTVNELEEAA